METNNITDLNSLDETKFEGIVRSSSPGTLGYWETSIETKDGVVFIGTFGHWEADTQVQGTIARTKSTPISFLVSHDIRETNTDQLDKEGEV